MKKKPAAGADCLVNYPPIIRRISARGKNYYLNYLVFPLTDWDAKPGRESLELILAKIGKAKKSESRSLPKLYKSAIVLSALHARNNLPLCAKLSLDFIKAMKKLKFCAKSREAREFISILSPGFAEFVLMEFMRSLDSINRMTDAESIETIRTFLKRKGIDAGKASLISREAINAIMTAPGYGTYPAPVKIRKKMINHILNYSGPGMPDIRNTLNPVFTEYGSNSNRLKNEIYGHAASALYNELIKSIEEKDLKKAYIRSERYDGIFSGPDRPYENIFSACYGKINSILLRHINGKLTK